MEQPLYSCRPYLTKRIAVSIFTGLFFSILFYGIVFFNLFILNIELNTTLNFIIILSLLFLMMALIIINYLHSKSISYDFFGDRIRVGKKSLYFRDIKVINRKIKFMDRYFMTGTVIVNNEKLEDVKQPESVENYLTNLTKNYQYYMTQNGR